MSDRETGQVAVFVVGMALVAFAVAGVAVDGTRAWLYRRTLQNAADAASLAGAAQLDRSSFYDSGGRALTLAAPAARAAAIRWLDLRGIDARAQVHAHDGGVRVVLRGEVRAGLLGLAGIDTIPVAVEADSEPLSRRL